MNDIWLIGEVGYEITLETVVNQVKNADKDKPLNVHIHSQGGQVYDGLAIYNYLKNLEQEVNTFSSGLVASIASVIFLAGNKNTRTINATDSFLIHLPSNYGYGNAQELEKRAEELRKIENQLAEIYEIETDLTKAEALDLMKKDDFLAVDFLKEKGFVSEIIELKAVAKLDKNEKIMSEHLTKNEADNLLEKWFNKFFPKNVNSKVIQDANGTEINFTELTASDEPNIEDVATVNDKKAVGDYVMPDGRTFTFEGGKLTAIKEAEPSEVEKLQTQVEDLTNELATAKNALTEKENTITELTGKVEEMRTEFETLKNSVSSVFNHDKTVNPKKEEPKSKARSILKTEEK